VFTWKTELAQGVATEAGLMRCIAQKWTVLRGLSASLPSRLQKQQRCEAAVSAHVGCQGSVRVDSLVQE